ncbi:RNA polymerase sigma-70 factor [Tenacibaculum holothuriorum]|uniref:RNA polymerase sigma-70 factor n=1 Tax=Tenacibaculum holothuriorum TaxID=1635173 RepID=A0A1Y2PGS6_9FLAO|nr:RNA polymerase sigma factor [Tenacibaculum holothuriorum]OSY88997.1 RNA polymerase sigma-70 factor [Tenacibaculum holothuriorum]
MELKKLIEQCCQNNMEAQTKVYQLYASKLFGICLKYSKNQQDAEDTLQDSFLTIYHKIHQYNFKGSFEGWMKRITINTAIQKYRKNNTLQIIKEEEIVEEEIILELNDDTIGVDFLLKLIQELPDRYRLVFNLYVLDNYSHKEIATMLSISEGTSKSNLSRAKSILKEKIEVYKQLQQEA